MSKPVQKVNENTYVIGAKTYLFGKCKNYLKKDLRDILTDLGVSYKSKDTNPILCELIEASLKVKFSKAAQAVQMAQAAQAIQAVVAASAAPPTSSSFPTPVVAPQALAVLLPNKLMYKGKTYDMKDCKKAFRDVKKEDLQKIGQILGIPFSAKATKEKMCDDLRKASHKGVQQVVQMQMQMAPPPPPPPPPPSAPPSAPPAAPTPSSPKSKIHVDGAPISLKDCASFDLPLLKALAKAVGTTYSKDKAVVCQRIQKKYKGEPLSLYSKDFTSTKKTTKKAPTPKAPTPKAPTPKQSTALEGLVYDTDTDSVVVAGHTFYMGRCEKYRAYKIADLQAMATALAIPFKGKKETGKTLCHKIEQLLLTLKPEKAKSPTPAKTPVPSPPKTPAAAALLPSPVKAMTAEEIREAVRKCLNLSK